MLHCHFLLEVLLLIIALVNEKRNLAKEVINQMAEEYSTTALPWKLSDCLTGSDREKASRLKLLQQLCKNERNKTFVVYSLVFQEEVDFIRSIGGFIWHLDGCLSDIAIHSRDLLVTTKRHDFKGYVPVAEAMSVCRLRKNSFNPMPEPRTTWYKNVIY